MIKYHEGVDLFSKMATMDNNDYIVHSCNSQGVWGAGFAKTLREWCSRSFQEYKEGCRASGFEAPEMVISHEWRTGPYIVSLIVSRGYGKQKDPPGTILKNTKFLLENLHPKNYVRFHSPKINSGLFGVPWEETEKIIQEFVNRTGCEWNVYSL